MSHNQNIPLFIDLDGTLTFTDTLVESVISLVKRKPGNLLMIPFWLTRGRAAFKSEIALRSDLHVHLLPYRQELIDYLVAQKAQGRQIILATAANQKIAEAVSDHLGVFNAILASDENNNLKGKNKLLAIQKLVGDYAGGFVYAGDSKTDLQIWEAASAAILVDTTQKVTDTVRQKIPVECEFRSEKTGVKIWLRALRVHQWMKNLLLFVPLLTAFTFLNIDNLQAAILAFLAFSLSASATYMGNDLWDLDSDRIHPRKKNRPFAKAQIPILLGVAVAFLLLLLGLSLAASVSHNFLMMLVLYLITTISYTWVLKTYVLIDVLVLSLLYTLRIIAGSVAVSVPSSSWLLAFSVFVFLSLALVKRCSELVTIQQTGKTATHGRDYRVIDLAVLWPLGVGSAISSIVVFGLFISATETQIRYQSPQVLWLAAVGLIYWLARLWIKVVRGEMHDDPLVFAVRDFGSRATIMIIICIVIIAHFITFG